MNILELSEQEIGRRESMQELRRMGIEPYPAAEYPTDAFSTDIIANFTDLPTEKDEEGNIFFADTRAAKAYHWEIDREC